MFNFPAFSGTNPNMASSGREWLVLMQHVDKIVIPVLFYRSLRDVEKNNYRQILQVRRCEKKVMFFMFASLLSDSIHVTYFGPLQCATRKA